jgi:FtsH-binding integral membrane protein
MMNGTLGMIYNIGGLLIFCGLTAYDTQKIKSTNIIGNEGSDEDHKETISGALKLYLDFINLFLFILRFTGNRRK